MSLRAGTFRLDITPPLGVSLAGFYEDLRAADVHDPLYVHALVLEHGPTQAAILSLDICAIPPALNQRMLARIHQLTGIPADSVTITATHTHSGPAVDAVLIAGVCSISPSYIDQLLEKSASAVRLAQLRLRPARLMAGSGINGSYVHNRRLRRPDGSIVMNWINPQYLQDAAPSGSVDPQLGIWKFVDQQNTAIALLINYANHNNAFPDPVSGGSAISADYAGVISGHLADAYGQDTVVFFLPGCAGNINWVDHTQNPSHTSSHAAEIGASLAQTVLAADASLEKLEVPWLRTSHRCLPVSERPFSAYDETIDFTFGPPERAMQFFDAYRQAREAAEGKPLPIHPVNLNVIRLGPDAVLCTNPAELFNEFGMRIKTASSVRHTLVAELTNGAIGYVPTQQAFTEGGYEVRKMDGASVLAVDAGDQIVQNLLEMVLETGGAACWKIK